MILSGIFCCEVAQSVHEPLESSSVYSTTCRCSTSLLHVAWRSITAWGLCRLLLIPSLDLSADFLEFKLEWGNTVRSVVIPHGKEFFWGVCFPGHISSAQEVVIEDSYIITSGNHILIGKNPQFLLALRGVVNAVGYTTVPLKQTHKDSWKALAGNGTLESSGPER